MKTRIGHPHQRAVVTLAGFVVFIVFVLLVSGGLASLGYVDPVILWIVAIFLSLFSLLLFIIWLLGWLEVQRVRSFLDSPRVLVQWTYTPAEWQQLKATRWQDEKDDWKVQFGCLSLLFALAGLLTGAMLGWEDGLVALLARGLVGALLGGLAGGVIGALVAGSNHWGARQAYRSTEPGLVALGVDEIYASADYFKGDGVSGYIRSVTLHPAPAPRLEFDLVVPPRPRMPSEEQWLIPVPPIWIERVEGVLPQLAPHAHTQPGE